MTNEPARVRPQSTTRLRSTIAATASLSLALLGTTVPLSASAAPAPNAATDTFAAGETFSGNVPDGVCFVTATVVGGSGASSNAEEVDFAANGLGASITATFAVLPGTPFSGSSGTGGLENSGRIGGVGGQPGGGAGGTVTGTGSMGVHGGAGGGGYSALYFGGSTPADLAVLAGGGGGSGGGHSESINIGKGGDAGLPTATGATAGQNGNAGFGTSGETVGGGAGGSSTAAGVGGQNSVDSALDGVGAVGMYGGAGGQDSNPDAGGGGGGGYFGGGGGASTSIYNGQGGVQGVTGGGGGGGASYVAADAVGTIESAAHGALAEAGDGIGGSVALDWVECAYDLALTKTAVIDTPAPAGATIAPVGSTVTWTISIVNNGPDRMTRGDVVTISDPVAGSSTTEITGITVTGGSDADLASGAVTCNAEEGDTMPTSLVCSRPYQEPGSTADGVRGLNVGETLTVSYTQLVTADDLGAIENVATVTDRQTGDTDDSDEASVTVVPAPEADDDADHGNTIGDAVTVTVLGNDTVANTPATVRLIDGTELVTSITVTGEGVWSVTGDQVVFTPEPGFLTDPTPVDYRVTDANGLFDTATVTVTYVPVASDDEDLGNEIGEAVTVDVLGNDTGVWNAASVVLLDADGDPVTTLVVTGEGTWTVDTTTGAVTFAPESGFLSDPTPVDYEVTDVTGDTVSATVTVTYVPQAADDEDLGNVIGEAVTVDVLGNDTGDWNASSVVLIDGTGAAVTTLVVAGEGTWTVDTATGDVTFTPETGFEGSPAPVDYEVTDVTGDTAAATITITYAPLATLDESHGNALGAPVVVDVVGSDRGDLVASSVRLIDGSGARVSTLAVPGEGTWAVDGATGAVTFTPEAGFLGNPTPVEYEIADTIGQTAVAEIVVTYLPESSDDVSTGNRAGSVVTVDILGNDRGVFDPATARLIDPSGARVVSLTVPGEGVWTVSSTTGAVTFTPEDGFLGDPTPVEYEVEDLDGNLTSSLVVVQYLPPVLASSGADLAPALGGLVLLLGGLGLLLMRRRVTP